MKSLKINYKTNSSELCKLGKKYDTDKSSQRNNVTNSRHCHPYTLFYDSLFNGVFCFFSRRYVYEYVFHHFFFFYKFVVILKWLKERWIG